MVIMEARVFMVYVKKKRRDRGRGEGEVGREERTTVFCDDFRK